MSWSSVPPFPHSPYSPRPQVQTSPSVVKNTVWLPPALTFATWRPSHARNSDTLSYHVHAVCDRDLEHHDLRPIELALLRRRVTLLNERLGGQTLITLSLYIRSRQNMYVDAHRNMSSKYVVEMSVEVTKAVK